MLLSGIGWIFMSRMRNGPYWSIAHSKGPGCLLTCFLALLGSAFSISLFFEICTVHGE